jgi:DNA-binding FadR family transcriptional regulator
MLRDKNRPDSLSDFLKFLASSHQTDNDRLPALADLSIGLGVSIASLREQLEVARAMGFVEVRPKTGIRRLPYTFRPAVLQSLAYAIAVDQNQFQAFSDLRKNIEAAYWFKAVALLDNDDKEQLRELVRKAQDKLRSTPVQLPHYEHRELHLTVYRKLVNPFVIGILEAYWDMYEAIGLDFYTDLEYLEKVWQFHQRMVEAVCAGNSEVGYQALIEHMDLISERSRPLMSQKFE